MIENFVCGIAFFLFIVILILISLKKAKIGWSFVDSEEENET